MISRQTLGQLADIQTLLRGLAKEVDDASYRRQYHADLSPLGWHLGHCVFVETYWLREVVLGDDRLTSALHRLYLPEFSSKPQRGSALPPQSVHLRWAATVQAENRERLADRAERFDHHLMERDYLPLFLLQHHCQHYETMLMVVAQRALRENGAVHNAGTTMTGIRPQRSSRAVPQGRYCIGSDSRPEAFDNEVPLQEVELSSFEISQRPVGNAEYLMFMEDGGYDEPDYWDKDGWAWRTKAGIQTPEHWRRDPDGRWYEVGVAGPRGLKPEAPVLGISHYEAQAFVRWARARLGAPFATARVPHEYEWEAACKLGLLEETGRVWEWCSNTFHPYEGFRSFPYERYSTLWFDGWHYTLRGGSRYSRPEVKRPSFRNFYAPDKRHIFAGFRLAF